ncbi:MAG: histidine--tRNA ligase [Betaproteobacteria bacterium]|nr:histidine--tRNA ligase [Betaproteobacteria bacterium]
MSKSPQTLQAVRGMNDLLPQDAPLWQFLEDTTREVFEQYGYRLMRAPVVEPTALFVRSIGEVTDIVEKEMYSFEDSMNGDRLTLRPEATAGLVRAAIEHNILYEGPKRIWTWGPMFRHERPQKGRLRQFHQFDVEAMGFAGPDVDAEQIVMLSRLWTRLGFKDVALHLNSIGDAAARQAHRGALVAYFETHQDQLDADAVRRLHTNPLRTLDTKNPAMQELVNAAPRLMDFLGEAEKLHFDGVKQRLDAAGLKYTVNPRLVRGFDYYNRTVFEFIAKGSKGGEWELTIAGGGRYDGLMEQLGGKPAPSCGFGFGVERVMMLLDENPPPAVETLDAYVIFSDGFEQQAFRTAEQLRDHGLAIALHGTADGKAASFKSQMKKADASGARFAIILGADEVAAGKVSVKPLREDGAQALLTVDEVVSKLWDGATA